MVVSNDEGFTRNRDEWGGGYGNNSAAHYGYSSTSPVGVEPDASNYSYGGPGEDYFRTLAQAADATKAPTMDMSGMQADRAQQVQALGMQQQAAMGNAPSVAQLQMQQIPQNAIMANMQAAAGGRGGLGGYAGGMGQAGAQMGAQNFAAGQGRANEIAQAQQAYSAGASGIRGADVAQAEYAARLNQQQMALNDQQAMAMYGFGQRASSAQQQGGMAYEAQLQKNILDQKNILLNRFQEDRSYKMAKEKSLIDKYWGAVSGASNLGGGIASMASAGGGGGGGG